MIERKIIGRCNCHSCGKSVEVKLNKNGNAYYFCPWSDDEGNPCSASFRWGRAASRKMVAKSATTAPAGGAQDGPRAKNQGQPPAIRPEATTAPAESAQQGGAGYGFF